MNKKLLLVLIAIGTVGAYGWFSQENHAGKTQYRTVAVDRGEVVRAVSVVGTLHPIQQVDIGAQVSGQITELLVDFNDSVKAGQVLARLKPTQFEARIKQAEADLSIAEANLSAAQASLLDASVGYKDAQRQWMRARDLFGKSLISQSDLDSTELKIEQSNANVKTREAQVDVAKASIRQRQAALTDAKTNLEHTVIRSPVDGIVIQRNVNLGQTLASNFQAPVLFVVAESLEGMQLEASVDEADIGLVKAGQSVSFTVDAFPDRPFSGSVKSVRLVPAQVQNVVTYTVIIHVDNSRQQLLPGMTANATIEIAREENALRIANAAVRFSPPDNATTGSASGNGAPAGGGPGFGGAGASGGAGGGAGMVERIAKRLNLDEQQKAILQSALRNAFASEAGREKVGEVFKSFRSELRPEQLPLFDEFLAERGSGANRKRVWTLDEDGKLKSIAVRVSASDDRYTAISGAEIREGMLLISGIDTAAKQ